MQQAKISRARNGSGFQSAAFSRFGNNQPHPWEIAYLKVFDHPFFAVTGEDGSFRLTGVEPGEYVLKAWHRRSGTPQEKRLQVTERKRIEQNFVFEAGR